MSSLPKPHSSINGSETDGDPQETREWLESFEAVVRSAGRERGLFLLKQLEQQAQDLGIGAHAAPYSAYRNTVSLEQQAPHPGNLALEERLTAIIRWNALAMVVRANQAYGDLGGHIASYASAAEIFEVGFNHFFRGPQAEQGGDLVFFQPHSAPGVYARAFLEGGLDSEHLAHYRQEVGGHGLCSYPHPWLMPDFWQFPTGSMGIGPISAIYQARFMRYLEHRGLAQTNQRHVWGVFGDGEMDEPEAIAGLTLAAREKLDNLTFIINCNLQRLDGPVRGNGQIIQELEALFAGAGWNVIKVLWGSDWDALFARDTEHALLKRFAATVDGQYQTLGANDGAYNQAHFFELDPALRKLVAHMSHAEIDALKRGGHDLRKLYAAFHAARRHPGQPTVILAKTKKGYGMGQTGESKMTSHQQKKLDIDALKHYRDRFHLPLTDEQLAQLQFYKPADDSAELTYLKARRAELGGNLPRRSAARSANATLPIPVLESYAQFALQSDGKVMSTTMAVVRLFTALLKDGTLGPRLVPIVADEARTFGMATLFRQIGIYAPEGQLYEPEDAESMLSYREKRDGQLLEEGITEAGALSSWVAAATSYSVHGVPMLPFYIFYSMFGFQRVGDLIWAAADQRARGFLIGATAGRTTLGGEGLQHQDGTSQLIASTVPNCRSYDPAFAGELAVILDHGLRQMLVAGEDVFYYLTVMNENYAQPSLPLEAHADVVKGMYLFGQYPAHEAADGIAPNQSQRQVPSKLKEPAAKRGVQSSAKSVRVDLLGSGAILGEVIAAAELLAQDWGISSDVYSVTSFSEVARDARATERFNRLNPSATPQRSHLSQFLTGEVPVVAATDYVCAYPQMIAAYVPGRFAALGTDGFGRSDTRASLRRFFEVDRQHVAIAALQALAEDGKIPADTVGVALQKYAIATDSAAPWTR